MIEGMEILFRFQHQETHSCLALNVCICDYYRFLLRLFDVFNVVAEIYIYYSILPVLTLLTA